MMVYLKLRESVERETWKFRKARMVHVNEEVDRLLTT